MRETAKAAPRPLEERLDRPASDFRKMASTVLPNNEQTFEKAASIDLDRSMSCVEAFRVIAGSCIRQIIANEPGMCAGHSEALHQFRVGLRRLRAATKAFAETTADPQQEESGLS